MKKLKTKLKIALLPFALLAFPMSSLSQTLPLDDPLPKRIEIDGMKLAATKAEVSVSVSIEDAWTALAQKFINVDEIAAGIVRSGGVEGFPEAGDGAARYCDINFKKREIKVKEKIVDWQIAEHKKEYMYDVYEFENFPMKKMYNVWGVREENGEVFIYNKVFYKMKPGMMTGLMRGQMKKVALDGVLSYKHYVETGEGNVASKVLREKYKNL